MFYRQGLLLLLSLFLTLFLGKSFCNADSSAVFENFTEVLVHEREEVDFNVTLIAYDDPAGVLFFQSINEDQFEVINGSMYIISMNMALPITFNIKIRGKTFSVSSLVISVSGVGSDQLTRLSEMTIKILRVPSFVFDNILTYVFFVPISISYLLMGFTLDMKLIWKCLKRPLPIGIGFICQFVAMPALAFGIGKLLQMDPATAIGLFLVGCCPGGKLSNDLSILMDADYLLSITMTACSSLLALGTVPLNIFIYSRFIVDSTFITPYDQIAIQLIGMIIPLVAGVLLRWKFPKYEKTAVKILKPVTAIATISVIATSIPFQIYIFLSPWPIYVSSLLLPLFGGIFGALLAVLARLKKEQVAAISFETGVQNAIIAYVILLTAFPQPEADLASRVPFVNLMMQFFLGMSVIAIYTVHGWLTGDKDQEESKELVSDGKSQSKSDDTELKENKDDENRQNGIINEGAIDVSV